MAWSDIGVNFTDKRLDFDPVLNRALEADVKQIIITGTNLQESREAINLAKQYPANLKTTIGVHPHDANQFSSQTIEDLKSLATADCVVAIGECGLDFNRNFSTPEAQIFAFEAQLQLACELGLPVFLHERDAFDTQIDLLSKYRHQLKGGVVHCFTGNVEQMHRYLALDLYIGITGWVCDLKLGQSLREAVSALPLEKVLLETDAPYLRPKGLPNNRKLDKGNNEPAYLPYIASEVAGLMAIDINMLQAASETNVQALFDFDNANSRYVK